MPWLPCSSSGPPRSAAWRGRRRGRWRTPPGSARGRSGCPDTPPAPARSTSVSPSTTEIAGSTAHSFGARPARCHARLEVVVEGAHLVLAALDGEHRLRPARRKVAPAIGAAGLHDHRMALRAARDRQRAARLDPAPLVIGVMHLRRDRRSTPAALSSTKAPGVPAVPQREAGLQHLVGPVVALLACGGSSSARHCAPRDRWPRSRRSRRPGPCSSRRARRASAPGDRRCGSWWRAWRPARDAASPPPSPAARRSGRGS